MEGELIRASSLQEAAALKDSDSAFFAGGTGIGYKDSGIHAGKLIVIPEADGIHEIARTQGMVRIGALVTFTQALEHIDVPMYLKDALRFCGSFQKRNRATIGGNIGFWRSDSYLIPTLIASGAVLCLLDSDGEKQIGIGSYLSDRAQYENALITSVLVKEDGTKDAGKEGVYVLSRRYANTVESHAYLTISMGRDGEGYRIGMAIKGSGIFSPDIMNWGLSWKKADVADDMYGSQEYKRYLAGVTLESMYEKLSQEGGEKS